MAVLDDTELPLLDEGAALSPQIETEEGKQLVVEALRDAEILDRDLDVVDDRFHQFMLTNRVPSNVLRCRPFTESLFNSFALQALDLLSKPSILVPKLL